jgi:hypothetical protein
MRPESCSALNGRLARVIGINPFALDVRAVAYNRISQLVFDWARSNYAAHVNRYEDADGPAPTPKLPRGRLLSPPELLKALQALRYNCDAGNGSGASIKPSLETLDTLIDCLKDHCLELLPEYQAAEWAI